VINRTKGEKERSDLHVQEKGEEGEQTDALLATDVRIATFGISADRPGGQTTCHRQHRTMVLTPDRPLYVIVGLYACISVMY
jgi:hypothetical protein